ncbi:MAG: ABC transporter permease [Deinococcota bacterium]
MIKHTELDHATGKTRRVVDKKLLPRRSRVAYVMRSLRQNRVGVLGTCIVLFVLFVTLLGPFLAPHDPLEHNLRARFEPPGYSDASGTYVLGTDQLGRDILSRVIAGARVSVFVGVVSVIIAGVIGVSYGLLSGFAGGLLDNFMMRVADAFLAIPFIVLVVAVSGVVGAGLMTLIVILGVTSWVTYARVTRAEVLAAREMDYVMAAKALGQNNLKIMFKHILPNVTGSIIVLATSMVATTMLAEAALSFLGLGVQPPTVTWGLMLSDGRQYIGSAWWMSTFPGIAITITVLGVVFVGDWLRDLLDPQLRGQ